MWKKFQRRINSLDTRLLIMLVILMVLMVLITFYLYRTTYVRVLNEAHEDFASLSEDMETRLDSSLQALKNAARQAGYNLSVQDYLFSASPELTISSQRSAIAFLSSSFKPGIPCLNVYLTGGGERYLRMNESYIDEYRAMLRQEDLETQIVLKSPRFVKANLGQGKETCYFYLYPIYGYSYSTISNQILCTILFDAHELILPLQSRLAETGTIAVLFQNSVIYSSSALSEEQHRSMISLSPGSSQRVAVEGVPCIASKSVSQNGDWQFVCLLPESEFTNAAFQSLWGNILYVGVALICFAAIVMLVILPTKRDLNKLMDGIQALEGQPPLQKSFVGGAKMTDLKAVDHALSQMVKRLNESGAAYEESQRKAYEARLAQTNAELLGYRSQINPHFLFNSMESLRSLAVLEHAEKPAAMASSMAGMFRYALQSPQTVSLAMEIQNAEDYLQVMNTRFQDRYELRKSLPDEALRAEISSMVLQPLVENCVTHAFPPRQSPCIIQLSATISEKTLRICVRDNGRGMEPEKLDLLSEEMHRTETITRDARSIGLKNVYHRLKLSYGEGFRMNLRAEPNRYMEIELMLPMRTERKNEDVQPASGG